MSHDIFGPSSLVRAVMCPASTHETLAASLHGPPPESEDAQAGTSAHAEIAGAIASWITDGDKPDEGTDAHAAIVWLQNFDVSSCEVLIEQTIDVDRRYGTPDVVLIEGDTAIVVDWKTGFQGPTDEEITYQLSAYCSLVRESHRDVARVEGWMVHIRDGEVRGEKHLAEHNHELTMSAWIKVVERNGAIVASGEPDESDYHIGDHCRYCPGAASCPAVLRTALRHTSESGGDVAEAVRSMPADRFSEVLEHLPAIETLAKAAKARARQMERDEPGSTGYYTMTTVNARRQLTNPTAFARWILDQGVSPEDLWSSLKIGPGDAQNLWEAATKPSGSKRAIKYEFARLTASMFSSGKTERMTRL